MLHSLQDLAIQALLDDPKYKALLEEIKKFYAENGGLHSDRAVFMEMQDQFTLEQNKILGKFNLSQSADINLKIWERVKQEISPQTSLSETEINNDKIYYILDTFSPTKFNKLDKPSLERIWQQFPKRQQTILDNFIKLSLEKMLWLWEKANQEQREKMLAEAAKKLRGLSFEKMDWLLRISDDLKTFTRRLAFSDIETKQEHWKTIKTIWEQKPTEIKERILIAHNYHFFFSAPFEFQQAIWQEYQGHHERILATAVEQAMKQSSLSLIHSTFSDEQKRFFYSKLNLDQAAAILAASGYDNFAFFLPEMREKLWNDSRLSKYDLEVRRHTIVYSWIVRGFNQPKEFQQWMFKWILPKFPLPHDIELIWKKIDNTHKEKRLFSLPSHLILSHFPLPSGIGLMWKKTDNEFKKELLAEENFSLFLNCA